MNASTGTLLLAHQVNISFSLGKEKGIHGGFRDKSVWYRKNLAAPDFINFCMVDSLSKSIHLSLFVRNIYPIIC